MFGLLLPGSIPRGSTRLRTSHVVVGLHLLHCHQAVRRTDSSRNILVRLGRSPRTWGKPLLVFERQEADGALRRVSAARLTGVTRTSRYVFTLDVPANEVHPSVGNFVFVMGWFTTLDRYR